MLTKNLRALLFAAIALLMAAAGPSASANQGGGPPLANSANVTIQDFFNVPDSDVSALVMREIFGPVAWERATGYSGAFTTQEVGSFSGDRSALEGGILGALSSVLNLACMMMVVIIVGWGLISANVSGTIQGLSVGQNYDPVWVPLRSVLSFGFLLPVVGGYSLVQIIGMKAIMLSIGIANAGFGIVLGFLFSGTPTVPVSAPNVSEVAVAVLAQEMCATFTVDHAGEPMVAANDPGPEKKRTLNAYNEATGETSWIKGGVSFLNEVGKALYNQEVPVLTVKNFSYDLLRGNGPAYCGSASITQHGVGGTATGGGAVSDALMTARIEALTQLRADMASIVNDIVAIIAAASDVNPSDTSGSGAASPLLALQSKYQVAVGQYRNAITIAAGSAAASIQANIANSRGPARVISGNQPLATSEAALRDGGWILLGSVYWNLATQNSRIQDVVNDLTVIVQLPDFATINSRINQNPQMANLAYTYYDKLVRAGSHDFNVMFDGSMPAAFSRNYSDFGRETNTGGITSILLQNALEAMNGLSLGETTVKMLTSEGDIVGNLSTLGKVFWNMGVVGFVISISGGKDEKSFVGKGVSALSKKHPLGKAVAAALGIMAAIAIPLLVAGFFLSFYLPMVPLILWIFNIVGWMLQSVKAVMALPVWAVAHAIPEGTGIAGMTARQGYVLLIGVVLRPLLLVVGIMTGAVMLQMAGWVVRYMAPSMVGTFNVTDPPLLFGFLAVLLIFVFIVITVALRCFALSHELADEILEWIGGNARTLGDGNSLGDVQARVGGGARTALESIAGGVAGGVAASRVMKEKSEKKDGTGDSTTDDKNKQSSTGNV